MYKITSYSKKQANKLNVDIVPSTNKKKKIDVYKDGKKIASIGSIQNYDYPTYIKTKGKEYADERRKLYKKRHINNRTVKGTPGFYADKILW